MSGMYGKQQGFFPILNQEYVQIECKCLLYVVSYM